MKLKRYSIKSSRAQSRVNWLQEETDVSGTICPHHQGFDVTVHPERSLYRGNQSRQNLDDGDRDGSRNVGFFLQPIDAAVCPR
jgi:hypothetical protein